MRTVMLLPSIVLTVLALAGRGAAAAEELVPFKTTIPQEVLVGTPPDVLGQLYPHLYLSKEEQKPSLKVPKGTVNLALKKPVTSSDKEPIFGKLSMVTDGDKEGGEENYVELGPGLQWVQIDLEKPSEIFAVYLWHFFREARSYHTVIVQVADDAEFTKNVRTLFNTDKENAAGKGVGKDRPYIETNFGRLIDAKGVKARYVRLYSDGNTASDLNHYVEVEVWGRPAEAQ